MNLFQVQSSQQYHDHHDHHQTASLSSIQYIDEETRTQTALKSPISLLNAEINGIGASSKISIGKKLFEKQKQTVSGSTGGNTSPFLRHNSLRQAQAIAYKYGAVNSGFHLEDEAEPSASTADCKATTPIVDLVDLDHTDDDADDVNERTPRVRAPTPPPRADTLLLSNVDIDICGVENKASSSSTSSLDAFFKSIQTKAFDIDAKPTSPSASSSEYIEIQHLFKNIDLIQAKLDAIKDSSSIHVDLSLAHLTTGESDLTEKLFSACHQDVQILRQMCEAKNFRNTLELYNKLIRLNGSVGLRPACASSTALVDEVSEDRFSIFGKNRECSFAVLRTLRLRFEPCVVEFSDY